MRDWTRVIWATPEARSVWEPRIQRIQSVWSRVEIASVEEGVRKAALVFGRPVTHLPLAEVSPNRFAVGEAKALAIAYLKQDDATVGDLLGYPPCCRAFFLKTWAAGALDTTAQMAGTGNGPIECNILGRWMGVRFVPHLPCSWDCYFTRLNGLILSHLWPTEEFALGAGDSRLARAVDGSTWDRGSGISRLQTLDTDDIRTGTHEDRPP